MSLSAVIYAKNLEPMTRFYEHLFGLQLASSAERYRVLTSDSIKLSLVTIPDEISTTIQLDQSPRRRTNAPISHPTRLA